MGIHVYTYDDPPSERDLGRALRALADDGLLAFPNDENWAFGWDAASSKAADKIRLLKPDHPKAMPFSLLCSSMSMAAEYAHIGTNAYRLLRRAWPGPYTVLLNTSHTFPRQLKDKRRVVGIRIPNCQMIRVLVEKLGRPLATTSVPPLIPGSDDVPPIMRRFGYEVFEAYGHGIDILLDLGAELSGIESTIVDFTEDTPVIVRRGAGDPTLFGGA